MADVNPTPPPEGISPQKTPGAAKPQKAISGVHFKPSGTGLDAFKKWLGPDNFKKFMSALCQSISNQIKQNQKEADLASRKLKAAAEGKDPDDITM